MEGGGSGALGGVGRSILSSASRSLSGVLARIGGAEKSREERRRGKAHDHCDHGSYDDSDSYYACDGSTRQTHDSVSDAAGSPQGQARIRAGEQQGSAREWGWTDEWLHRANAWRRVVLAFEDEEKVGQLSSGPGRRVTGLEMQVVGCTQGGLSEPTRRAERAMGGAHAESALAESAHEWRSLSCCGGGSASGGKTDVAQAEGGSGMAQLRHAWYALVGANGVAR